MLHALRVRIKINNNNISYNLISVFVLSKNQDMMRWLGYKGGQVTVPIICMCRGVGRGGHLRRVGAIPYH